jgi:hypothetical protein
MLSGSMRLHLVLEQMGQWAVMTLVLVQGVHLLQAYQATAN